MKKRVLKPWVKESLLFIPLLIVIAVLINVDNKLSNNFMENCESAGYSHSYCLAHNN